MNATIESTPTVRTVDPVFRYSRRENLHRKLDALLEYDEKMEGFGILECVSPTLADQIENEYASICGNLLYEKWNGPLPFSVSLPISRDGALAISSDLIGALRSSHKGSHSVSAGLQWTIDERKIETVVLVEDLVNGDGVVSIARATEDLGQISVYASRSRYWVTPSGRCYFNCPYGCPNLSKEVYVVGWGFGCADCVEYRHLMEPVPVAELINEAVTGGSAS